MRYTSKKSIERVAKTGDRAQVKMRNRPIIFDGVLYVDKTKEEKEVYFCSDHSILNGLTSPDKLGYEYSWELNEGTFRASIEWVEIVRLEDNYEIY